MQDVLERPITSYMHRLFVIVDENANVASAVQQMHSHNAGIIIASRGNIPVGIVTDSDIIDKVVMRGEDSDQVFLKAIIDRKSTRLNSSHANISYAVFCLKKKYISLPCGASADFSLL